MPCTIVGCVIAGLAFVIDGDTLQIGPDRIRIHAINAPERDEPGGGEATEALRSIIADQPVRCVWHGTKTHRRYISVCTVGSVDLGRAMVAFLVKGLFPSSNI